jgi:hypothetical protein
MYGAVWDTTKAVKDKMSAVVKLSAAFWPCIPETALLTFCTGTLGYFHPVYCDANCVAAQMLEHGAGRWPKEALRFSFEGSRCPA